jgi:thymidylate synthase
MFIGFNKSQKGDVYFKRNLIKINKEGYWDYNPRPKYEDGSLAYSKYITNVYEEYDISKGEYPITTLRNTAVKTGIREILWIYQKQSNSLKDAHDMGITWWDNWDIGDGTIGQRYGATIKKYNLLNNLIEGLMEEPFSRRHIIDMYQYSDLEETIGLHPCAYSTIWSVRVDKSKKQRYLDMVLVQRSSDYIVSNYINKIQYLALQMIIARHIGYNVGKFCHYVNNLHIYDRHFSALNEILNRKPLKIKPKLLLSEDKNNFYDITIDDFILLDFDKVPKIKSDLDLAI